MKKITLFGLLLAVLIIPSVSFASFDTSIKYGSRGQAVVDLQDFLTDQGTYTGKLDGRFGLGTLKSLEAWQTSVGLSADGYFGRGSRAKANEILASLLQGSDATELSETGTIAPTATVPGCNSNVGYSVTTGTKCDGTSSVSSDTQTLISKVNDLSTKLDAQTQLQQQIVTNTTSVSAPAVIPVVSKKELQIVSLAQPSYGQAYTNCRYFKATVLDDNGAEVSAPYPLTMKELSQPNQVSNFGGGGDKNEVTYCFPDDKTTQDTLTFTYVPLNLSNSITVTNN